MPVTPGGGGGGGAAWGDITGALGDQTDLQTALDEKLATDGDGSALTGLTKAQVGLSNVENTADANKPVSTAIQTALDAKQATLVSATNIKTINGDSVLGSGDLVVTGSGAAWGEITGTLSDQTDLQTALDGKAASLGADDNYVTDAEKTKLANLSGTNTGDQTSIVGITGTLAQFNTACSNADFATGGGTATGTNTGDQTTITGNAGSATVLETARTINGVSFNGSANITVTAAGSTLSDNVPVSKLNSGTGASSSTFWRGDATWAAPSASLTSASAFATATTTISAATYADITGASVSLAAGTWIVFGQVTIGLANAIIQAFVALTHSDNTVISEVAASRPASGTASLISPFTVTVVGIVSPGSTTTYKLRGARGLTTHTGSWTAMDGNGVNTTNHASNNSDKSTAIFAVKIA